MNSTVLKRLLFKKNKQALYFLYQNELKKKPSFSCCSYDLIIPHIHTTPAVYFSNETALNEEYKQNKLVKTGHMFMFFVLKLLDFNESGEL